MNTCALAEEAQNPCADTVQSAALQELGGALCLSYVAYHDLPVPMILPRRPGDLCAVDLQDIRAHNDSVRQVSLSRNDMKFVTASDDSTLKVPPLMQGLCSCLSTLKSLP